MSTYRKIIDTFFDATIIVKGIDSVLEMVGGILLIVVKPSTIDRVVTLLTQHELSKDPHDFFANFILHTASGISKGTELTAAAYLIVDSIIKLFIINGLLHNRRWSYKVAMVFLTLFIAYKCYRIALHHHPFLAIMTILDVVTLWLIYREYDLRFVEVE
jgi:uncharacterized membrane protein